MSEENLNKEQIQAYLKKMHAGHLSADERWQLERASLDDPFLADALEGYYDNGGDHASAIDTLNKKINTEIPSEPRRKIIPMRWLSIAAAVAVLLGVSFWLFNATDQPEFTTTADNAATQSSRTQSAKSNYALDAASQKAAATEVIEEKTATARTISKNKVEETASTTSSKKKPQSPTTVSKIKLKPVVKKQESVQQPESAIEVEEEVIFEDSQEGYRLQDAVVANESRVITKKTTAKSKSNIEVAESKKETTTYDSQADDHLFTEEIMMNASKDVVKSPEPSPPSLEPSQLVLLDIDGRALPGVEILDQNNNQLGSSDTNGNFTIPQGLPYVTTAFAGYDSLTIASGPNLTVQMQTSADLLGQAHMRLIDMMDDGEVIRHYSNQLNSLFAREWPLCPNRNNDFGFFTTTSVYIVVDTNASVSDIRYFRDLDASCEAKISEVIELAIQQGIFEKGRPVSFTFRVNL